MPLEDRTPLERAALAYCAPRGIPLSMFLGRTVYPGEPQWLSDDTTAALEWQVEQDRRCPDCGRPTDESHSPEAEDGYRVEGIRCHGCKAIHDEVKTFGKDGVLAGMRWRVFREEVEDGDVVDAS